MNRWEYMVSRVDANKDIGSIETHIDEHGGDGWELVSVIRTTWESPRDSGASYMLFYKRQKVA